MRVGRGRRVERGFMNIKRSKGFLERGGCFECISALSTIKRIAVINLTSEKGSWARQMFSDI